MAQPFFVRLCYMYESIFVDWDDAAWAFPENARDTFQDMYDKYRFDRYSRSLSHFCALYRKENERLNLRKFSYPLHRLG